MEKVQIEKYIPNPVDHQKLRRIFSQGIQEHVKPAIPISLKSPKIHVFLGLAFTIGYFNSLGHAVFYLIIALAIQSICVFTCYYGYVW